jgi:hypothetical protein
MASSLMHALLVGHACAGVFVRSLLDASFLRLFAGRNGQTQAVLSLLGADV